jgi:tight adherence protein C
MTIGMVAFLFGLATFLAVYAFKAPVVTIHRDELDTDLVGVVPVDPNASGLFERLVRPAVRNLLPQTPMAAQLKARHSNKTIELLVRSGNPWNIQPEEFFGIKILAGIGGFMLALLLVLMEVLPAYLPPLGWLALGALIGQHIPKVLLDGAKGRRLKEARRGLPEALDLLVITLNSGMNFTPALAEVVSRLPEGVIKEELTRVSADLRSGKNLQKSLTDFARRAPSEEVESFAKSVVVSEKLGADVSETLKSQADAARAAYEAALDEKIGKLPTTLFFPILALMLPALFIVILAPAFANIAGAF